MRTVRVSLASWQPPSSCACCLQGTSDRVALSPRGVDVLRATPSIPLPLCESCREHVLFEQRGGERRITLATLVAMASGALMGLLAVFAALPQRPFRLHAAAAAGLITAGAFGLLARRIAGRSRPHDLLDEQHTRRGAPVEMSVEGTTACLRVHSDVFGRLLADAHAPRPASSDAPWLR